MKVQIDLSNIMIGDKSWNAICDAFQIPEKKRYESWVAEAILERVRTYLSSYIGRRSQEEQENGAALTPPPIPQLEDILPKEGELG